MLEFRAEKDALIAELEEEKSISDEARRRAEAANSRQVALPRHHEPRAAHAAQRHPRLLRGDEGGAARPDAEPELPRIRRQHPRQRPPPAAADQRDPRPVAHRGRPLRAARGAGAARRRSSRNATACCSCAPRARACRSMLEFAKGLEQIWADERAMRQICLNLMSNALKFTPARRPHHARRCEHAARAGRR